MAEMCVSCHIRPARENRATCEVCAAKYHERYIRHMEKSTAAGLCPSCGKPMDRKGYKCSACNDKMREYQRAMSADRKRLHLCVRCLAKDERTLGGYTLCARCTELGNERHRDRYWRKKAEKNG